MSTLRSRPRAAAFVAAALLLLAGSRDALGQREARGTVRDSASRLPVPGVVLLLLDAGGTTLGRNITNERGEYRIALSPDIRRIRFVRIGFRPRESVIPRDTTAIARLDVTMVPLPATLATVRVRAPAHCPRRADEAPAFALLEQARAGLLAVVVARQANPAALVRLGFRRRMEDNTDRIVRQTVRIERAANTAISFDAVRTPAEFLERGFLIDSGGSAEYLGPDADVLLDDAFAEGYCFRLAGGERARPNQLGLSFSRPARAPARVDIEGTVWIDTAARALVDIEYLYAGLPRQMDRFRPGGSISFRTMPNGVALIDRWVIRMVAAEQDTISGRRRDEVRTWLYGWQSGGELAQAIWPDGHAWKASLGTLRVRASTHAGKAASGLAVRLADTDYRARADSVGDFEISDLVPGPYRVNVVDPALVEINLELETKLRFVAERDSTIRALLDVPTADDTTIARCVTMRRYSMQDSVRVLGRVMRADGTPVPGVRVGLAIERGGPPAEPVQSFTTGYDGLFHFCPRRLELGMTISIWVYPRSGGPPAKLRRILTERLTIIRAPLDG